MKQKVLSLLAGVMLVTGANSPVRADEVPSAEIRQTIDAVKSTVKAEKGKLAEDALDVKLRGIIAPMFNFEEMSRRCLGPEWNKASAGEQQEFVKLFSELLERTYLKRIRQNAETSVIKEMNDSVTGDKALVKSVIHAEDDDVSIDYRLLRDGARWRIYDVVVENVGLVTNYRSEFPDIIRKEGFTGLLTRLRNKQIATPKVKGEA